ncbi:glutathione peroxidase [Haematococcus lacustris]
MQRRLNHSFFSELLNVRLVMSSSIACQVLRDRVTGFTARRRVGRLFSASRAMSGFYGLSATAADGSELPMSSMAGQVVLVVNVASKCGFTNQYKELQALYDKYKEQGLSIIGAPCNQFGGQEPGSEAEIVSFCQRNYGVGFPILTKLEVNGENTHPLYQWLKGSKKMMGLKTDISWNFEKFLVDRKGEVVQRFSSMAGASSIEPEVVKLLAQQA